MVIFIILIFFAYVIVSLKIDSYKKKECVSELEKKQLQNEFFENYENSPKQKEIHEKDYINEIDDDENNPIKENDGGILKKIFFHPEDF